MEDFLEDLALRQDFKKKDFNNKVTCSRITPTWQSYDKYVQIEARVYAKKINHVPVQATDTDFFKVGNVCGFIDLSPILKCLNCARVDVVTIPCAKNVSNTKRHLACMWLSPAEFPGLVSSFPLHGDSGTQPWSQLYCP